MRYSGMAVGGGGYRPYSAGSKVYGAGRSMPTIGPVDPLGYRERDAKQKARRAAILARLKAGVSGDFASPNYGRRVR
jgi:hypothetical protein